MVRFFAMLAAIKKARDECGLFMQLKCCSILAAHASSKKGA